MELVLLPEHEVNCDLGVVNAARVSMKKRHEVFDDNTDTKLLQYLFNNDHWTPFAHPTLSFIHGLNYAEAIDYIHGRSAGSTSTIESRDSFGIELAETGSLWYWINNMKLLPEDTAADVASSIVLAYPNVAAACGVSCETSAPAAQADITEQWVSQDIRRAKLIRVTAHVKAPIPIRTQCFKHKIDFVENEVSRRYVSETPEFYHPDMWRRKSETKKQGSDVRPCVQQQSVADTYGWQTHDTMATYDWLVGEAELCPEQARFFVPQGMYTEWYWTGTLQAFKRFVVQRTHPHAQLEVRELALQADKQLGERYPLIWSRIK